VADRVFVWVEALFLEFWNLINASDQDWSLGGLVMHLGCTT